MAWTTASMNSASSTMTSGCMALSPGMLMTSSLTTSIEKVSKRLACPRSLWNSSMSLPMYKANSAWVGARPSSAAKTCTASFSFLLNATAERGRKDCLRTSSRMAPRTRLSAKCSNSKPLVGSKDRAASIRPTMPT